MSNEPSIGLHPTLLAQLVFAAVLFCGLQGGGGAFAQGTAVEGVRVFQAQCAVCHSDRPGVTGFGPTLAGVVGRTAATIPGFDYTSALKSPA